MTKPNSDGSQQNMYEYAVDPCNAADFKGQLLQGVFVTSYPC
jgi:hypothetical protein